MPDEIERWLPADAAPPGAIDLIDDLAHFCFALPAWCGSDGLPRSWRHYVHGCRFLARRHLREQLAGGQAARMAQAVTDDYNRWQDDLTRRLEVPRG